MGLLLDSFWRAVASCLHPRVIAMSVLPLALMAVLGALLGYFYWDAAVQGMRSLLESSTALAALWTWLQEHGAGDVRTFVAPVMVVLAVSPLLVIVSLLAVAVIMTPVLVRWVAGRRFASLERKKGASFFASLAWSLSSTLLALLALVVSVPLWLVPPLVLILPPLIWGWLTYRVMVFDALADHASKEERLEITRRHRSSLLVIGVIAGYLGAAPSIVWASGVVFAVGFIVLVPFAIWIYTLVFAFSALWFVYYCLGALERLRQERAAQDAADGVQAGAVTSPAPVAGAGGAGPESATLGERLGGQSRP